MWRSCAPGHLTASAWSSTRAAGSRAADPAPARRAVGAARRPLRARRPHDARRRRARGARGERHRRAVLRPDAARPATCTRSPARSACRPGTSTCASSRSRRRAPMPVRSDESVDLQWFPWDRLPDGVAPELPRLIAARPAARLSAVTRRTLARRDWPVGAAAAAVVGPTGVLEATGPVDARRSALASVTKPLAALAILVAVEEEAVDLDDPADEELLPGATLRHLLAHASGSHRSGRCGRAAPGTPAHLLQRRHRACRRRSSRPPPACRSPQYLRRGGRRARSGWARHRWPDRPRGTAGRPSTDLARVAARAARARPGCCTPTPSPSCATVQYPGLRGVLPGFGGQDPQRLGPGLRDPRRTSRRTGPGRDNSRRTYRPLRPERHDALDRSRRASSGSSR